MDGFVVIDDQQASEFVVAVFMLCFLNGLFQLVVCSSSSDLLARVERGTISSNVAPCPIPALTADNEPPSSAAALALQ